jgi:lipopolysaccharide export system permease protein
MRTVDRYLLSQFLRGFMLTWISLMGLYVVADFMGNLSAFVDHGQETGSLWRVAASYYGARLPWFFDLAGRVVVLLSAVLTLGTLHRHNELTAILAAGISPRRIAKPLILAGIVISLIAVANREFGVPRVRDLLCRSVKELSGKRQAHITPQYDHATDILFEGDAIQYETSSIDNPRFHLATTWAPIGHSLTAKSATYQAATAQHPAGYLLNGLEPGIDWREIPSYRFGNEPVVLTPRDAPWLTDPASIFVVSNLTLEQLHRGQQWQQYSSTVQLVAGLHNRSLDYGANTRVLIHSRFVQPLLDVTLLVMGLPIALGADRKGVFVAAGKTILLVIFFSLTVIVSNALGGHGVLTPALAAWAPLMLFAPLMVFQAGPLWD